MRLRDLQPGETFYLTGNPMKLVLIGRLKCGMSVYQRVDSLVPQKWLLNDETQVNAVSKQQTSEAA